MKPPLTPAQALRRRCAGIYAAQRRRAQADGAALNYDADDLAFLAERAKWCCYCKNPFALDQLRFDHRQSIANGGRHAVDNLVVCCVVCNEVKGLLDEDEFRQLLNLIGQFRPRSLLDVLGRLRAGGRRYARRRKART
jgi:5-methylcytosine-specific restriction endonuclease McrA